MQYLQLVACVLREAFNASLKVISRSVGRAAWYQQLVSTIAVNLLVTSDPAQSQYLAQQDLAVAQASGTVSSNSEFACMTKKSRTLPRAVLYPDAVSI